MKKTKIFLIFAMALLLFVPGMCFAQVDMQDNVFITKEKVIEYNYFKAGNTIDIGGTLKKDAYVFGQAVSVDGVIEGDLIGFASSLKIDGEVKGNVRFVAENIVINGKIGKNVSLLASMITIGPEAQIDWELLAAGNIIEVDGKVNANANLTGASVTVNNEINGWLFANVENGVLRLGEQAKINGNIEYYAQNDLQKDDSAIVSGEIEKKEIETSSHAVSKSSLADYAGTVLFCLAAYLIITMLMIALWPKQMLKITEEFTKNFWLNLLVGLLVLIVLPIAIIIIAITLIGLPLSIILFVLYLIGLYLGRIFFALGVSMWLMKLFKNKKVKYNLWLMALLGLLITVLLIKLPYIGWLVSLIAMSSGFGALIMYYKKSIKK